MADTYTTNLGLTKPGYDSIADIAVINENMDKIDEAIGDVGASLKYGKAVIFGDSLGQGYLNNDYSFVDILRESGAFESFAKHCAQGTTIGPYSTYSDVNDYCLINMIEMYTDDIQSADIVFLEYFGNDMGSVASSLVSYGFATDSATKTTVCGYLKKALARIRELNPTARIIYLTNGRLQPSTITSSMDVSATLAYDLYLIAEATMLRVLREQNVHIIDVMGGFPNKDSYYSIDGLHPTTAGHEQVAKNVLANMCVNSELPSLSREVAINADTNTANALFSAVYTLIKAGGVDVRANILVSGGSFYAQPTLVNESAIFFITSFVSGSTIIYYAAMMLPDGTVQTASVTFEGTSTASLAALNLE